MASAVGMINPGIDLAPDYFTVTIFVATCFFASSLFGNVRVRTPSL
jgi:hypothetical protein